MTQTFSCKYCKGEELLSFRESHQESITFPTYNSDIKLLCSRDHRTRLLLSADAGENSPPTENSPWREHLRGKVVRNHSIRRSTNAPQLGKDVIITILSTCGMHYPKNGTCNITILSTVWCVIHRAVHNYVLVMLQLLLTAVNYKDIKKSLYTTTLHWYACLCSPVIMDIHLNNTLLIKSF